MPKWKTIVIAGLLAALPAWGNSPTPSLTPAPSIGVATMDQSGTIVLLLRAEGRGSIGDGRIEYKKDDPNYAKILQHLGGLHPGQSKPVPPFGD